MKWTRRLLAAAALMGLMPFAHGQSTRVVKPSIETSGFQNDGKAAADTSSAKLADQLANPIANLISVPFQYNYDCCYGQQKTGRDTLNIQPVLPFQLSADWNLITRTIVPVIRQGDDSGLGDVVQTFFFSPAKSHNGLTWGAGPVFLWPTGDSRFSARKMGLGPSVVALKQELGVTYGLLANHIWSVGGDAERPDVSATFIQPFIVKTFPDSTGITLLTESTYDWRNRQWTVPVGLVVSHIFRFGEQPVSMAIGGRYYLDHPTNGPTWGARLVVTFLFPK